MASSSSSTDFPMNLRSANKSVGALGESEQENDTRSTNNFCEVTEKDQTENRQDMPTVYMYLTVSFEKSRVRTPDCPNPSRSSKIRGYYNLSADRFERSSEQPPS